jgi:hypothetical protein
VNIAPIKRTWSARRGADDAVPWITLEDGTQAIASVGAARDVIGRAPESVQTLYLATHGLVRQTHARALVWDGQTPMLQGADDEDIGLRPLVIAVIALGVAAILATAAYFIHHDTIEIDGRSARTTSILSSTLDLARSQLETTGKIDPSLDPRPRRARRWTLPSRTSWAAWRAWPALAAEEEADRLLGDPEDPRQVALRRGVARLRLRAGDEVGHDLSQESTV